MLGALGLEIADARQVDQLRARVAMVLQNIGLWSRSGE